MEVGNRIKERRTELNLSINELARILNVAPSTILRYENSDIKNMGIDKIADLAHALRCDPGYLLGWQEAICEGSKKLVDEYSRKYLLLTDEDKSKVNGYIDAMLDDPKYKKDIESRAI